MTTFTAPMHVSGREKSIPGDVLVSQTATILFTDTTIPLFTIPGPARIIDFYVDVITVFNAGSSNLLDIGTNSGTNQFANDLALTAAARLLGSSDGSRVINYARTADTAVTATYVRTGTNPSAGSAVITAVYALPFILPA